MNDSVREAWALLPDYLGQHVILSVSALLLGVAVSVPLGIAAAAEVSPPRSVFATNAKASGYHRLMGEDETPVWDVTVM